MAFDVEFPAILDDPRVSAHGAAALSAWFSQGSLIEPERLGDYGIRLIGPAPARVIVRDPRQGVGQIAIEAFQPGNTLFFDNVGSDGASSAYFRILGTRSRVIFRGQGGSGISLPIVFMRSDRQTFYWGENATAVSCSVEIEGEGAQVIVGDDALIANGVWIRTHDMHTLYDLAEDRVMNAARPDTVIERHVWLAQEALLMRCPRIGFGSIVGARALVRGPVPPMSAIAGIPARVVRSDVSWGRSAYEMGAREKDLLATLRTLPEAAAV